MPTYQYACTDCGHQLEAVQSFADKPLTECPACQGRLRKIFSSVGIVFKGSGFYRTDSRDETRNTPRNRSSESADSAAKQAGTNGSATKKEGTGSKASSSESSSSGSTSTGAATSSSSNSGPAPAKAASAA